MMKRRPTSSSRYRVSKGRTLPTLSTYDVLIFFFIPQCIFKQMNDAYRMFEGEGSDSVVGQDDQEQQQQTEE